eukprot:365188-Chlamydomonas_euryale.AAC.9
MHGRMADATLPPPPSPRSPLPQAQRSRPRVRTARSRSGRAMACCDRRWCSARARCTAWCGAGTATSCATAPAPLSRSARSRAPRSRSRGRRTTASCSRLTGRRSTIWLSLAARTASTRVRAARCSLSVSCRVRRGARRHETDSAVWRSLNVLFYECCSPCRCLPCRCASLPPPSNPQNNFPSLTLSDAVPGLHSLPTAARTPPDLARLCARLCPAWARSVGWLWAAAVPERAV